MSAVSSAMHVLEIAGVLSVGCIAVVWVVYPVAMGGLAAAMGARRAARGRSHAGGPPPDSSIAPGAAVDAIASSPLASRERAPVAHVSVILATRDDEVAIRQRVESLLASDYDAVRLEVVVALDAASGRDAASLAFLDARVLVVAGDVPGGKASALNSAVRAARGDVLVFADTHQRFERTAIRHLVAALDDERVGAVSGRLELPRGCTRMAPIRAYWAMEKWLRRSEARVHSSVGVTGAIWALRRSLWRPLPAGLILDDVYTPMRIVLEGHRVAFAEDAVAVETRAGAPEHEYRRKLRTLTGNVQLCAWLPQILNPLRNPIWAQLILHKMLRLLTPYWATLAALWALVATLRWLLAHPTALAAAALAVALSALVTRLNILRLVGDAVATIVLVQAATVMATVNGLRGRWDVWRR